MASQEMVNALTEEDPSVFDRALRYVKGLKGLGAPLADRANEAMMTALGPHGRKAVAPVAGLANVITQGADLRDMVDFSGRTVDSVRSGDLGGAAINAIYTAAAPIGMALPGSVGGYKKSAESMADSLMGVADDVDPSMPASLQGNRIFAGRNAAGAPLDKLARAEELERSGEPAEAVWGATDWFRGQDGKWRFEVDDSAAALSSDGLSDTAATKMGQFMDHPDLYRAHPDVSEIYTTADSSLGRSGSYAVPESRKHMGLFDIDEQITVKGDDRRSTTLHELQHAVQRREGFARGSSRGDAVSEVLAEKNAVLNKLEKGMRARQLELGLGDSYRPSTNDNLLNDLRNRYDVLVTTTPTNKDLIFDRYRNSAGETEARNVQTRMDMTPDERAASFPRSTEDVPAGDQVVRFGDIPSMSLPTDEASRMAVNKSEKDASDIFGAGATRVIYKDQATGGYIEVVKRPDGPSSVIDLQVPEQHRRRGVGAALQKAALDDNPKLMGQVSSKSAARSAFNQGRRPYDNPNATIDDVLRSIDENSSVNMTNLNLPTDEASRMARAQEMGFDTDVHHGTRADIDEFSMDPYGRGEDNDLGIHVGTKGQANDIVEYGPTAQIMSGDQYAESANIMPLKIRGKKFLELEDPMTQEWEPHGVVSQLAFISNSNHPNGIKLPGVDNFAPKHKQIREGLQKLGYDGIVYRNMMEGSGADKSYIVFDPKNIRSKFAQFDPAKAGSADILAGLAGLGVLGAGATALPQDDSDMVSALRGM